MYEWLSQRVLMIPMLILVGHADSPALAQGVWVLADQSKVRNEVNPLSGADTLHDIQFGGNSITHRLTFEVPGRFGYRGGMTCTGTWSPPPNRLKAGDRFTFESHVETRGSDTRGGYHIGHGCQLYVGITLLDENGNATAGYDSGIDYCRTAIGGGQTTSDQCDIRADWQVPDGTHGQGLVFSPTVGGSPTGVGAWGYRFVYQADAAPEESPHRPITPPPPPIEEEREVRPGPSPVDHSADVCPGAPVHVPTFSRWTSLRPGQRTFSGQPDQTWPLTVVGGNHLLSGNQFVPGQYMASVALSDPDGMTVARWETLGPYTLDARTKYLGALFRDPQKPAVRVLKDSPTLGDYSTPHPERFMFYARNDEPDHWMSICVYPLGGSVEHCCFGGTVNVRPDEAVEIELRPDHAGPVRVAEINNGGSVHNNPTVPVVFQSSTRFLVKLIRTYHFNSGQGQRPGSIGLQGEDGRIHGPWHAEGWSNLAGKLGPPSLYWVVNPNAVLPAGKYRLIDSDPETWATNAQAQGRGFFRMEYQELPGG